MEPKILGQGSYGCVIKPSLKCDSKDKSIIYDNKVSKIMMQREAVKEQSEMEFFKDLKEMHKYTVGYPELCKPKKNPAFRKLARECYAEGVRENIRFSKGENIYMLLLDDAGVDYKNVRNNLLLTLSLEDKKIFFCSILNLIEGLKYFKENELIHHDIKVDNLVYNVKTGESKYIDFGLVERKKDFIKQANRSKNEGAVSWFNYSPELSCVNKKDFKNKEKCEEYHEMKYDDFLQRAADGLDIYSLSKCLSDMFKSLILQKVFDVNFLKECRKVFSIYCKKDMKQRIINIDSMFAEYDELLKLYNVKINKTPTPLIKTLELAEKLSITKKSLKMCPSDKPVINPNTNRCVKACNDNEERNEKFRCIKTVKKRQTNNKTMKSSKKPSKKSSKICPSDKPVINPNTNRCVKACNDNEERNEKFRCIKTVKKRQSNNKTKKTT